MSSFTIEGKEVIRKVVKPQGTGAVVFVPKAWVGKKITIVLEEE